MDVQHEIVVLETDLEGYVKEVTEVLQSTLRLQDDETRGILHAIMLMLQRSWILDSKYACLEKTISNRFVSYSTFSQQHDFGQSHFTNI